MDFNSTVKGSLLEGFYPEGWDFKKIDECCSHKPEEICERQSFWNDGFEPVSCDSLGDFEVKMGHEIANEINQTYVGKEIRVLVDGKSKNNERVYTSRTEGNKIVHFECDKDFTGSFINVKITRADTFALYGEKI